MRYFNCLNPVHTLSDSQMSSCPKIVARTASIIFFIIMMMIALCTFFVIKYGDPVENENTSQTTSSSSGQTLENFSRFRSSNRNQNSKSIGELDKEKQKNVPLGLVVSGIMFSIFIYFAVFNIFKLKINQHKSIIRNYMDKYGVSKTQAIKDTYNF